MGMTNFVLSQSQDEVKLCFWEQFTNAQSWQRSILSFGNKASHDKKKKKKLILMWLSFHFLVDSNDNMFYKVQFNTV